MENPNRGQTVGSGWIMSPKRGWWRILAAGAYHSFGAFVISSDEISRASNLRYATPAMVSPFVGFSSFLFRDNIESIGCSGFFCRISFQRIGGGYPSGILLTGDNSFHLKGATINKDSLPHQPVWSWPEERISRIFCDSCSMVKGFWMNPRQPRRMMSSAWPFRV
jgi:hypothetical protein